jgi:hypothetical protein
MLGVSTPMQKVESMLRAKFTKSEYEELTSQPRFSRAMTLTNTPEKFERLCEAGEEILKVKKSSHPAARQFRQSSQTRTATALDQG